MDWNYSNPLSEALLASRTNQANLFHKPYFSSYDPMITKYPNRPSYINRSNVYDDIDELALQVETENLLTSRYRPINQLNYVPSYFNKNNQASLEENNFSNEFFDDRLNENSNAAPVKNPPVKTNKIPQQPPKFGKKSDSTQNQKNSQNKNNNSPQNRNKTRESESDLVAGQVPIQAHNSQEQRFLQYQQRMAQQQQQQQQQPQFQQNENSLSELEILKLKQQQDRQQLLANLGQKQVHGQNQFQLQHAPSYSNQNIYAPFFQPNYFKTQKQYSEASIPSTNADPLNSNNPTPPLFAQRDHIRKNQSKPSDDDPGSYLNTLKETRLREQRLAKDKYTTHDYKKYQKNFGFGRDFLPFENETKEEKMEKAKKRGEYAKFVKERNSDKYAYNDNAAFIRRTQNQKFDLDVSGGNKRQNRK